LWLWLERHPPTPVRDAALDSIAGPTAIAALTPHPRRSSSANIMRVVDIGTGATGVIIAFAITAAGATAENALPKDRMNP
jgi:hypothetical protein